ncbi:TPA: hypothetical protein ACNVX4_005936 [Pseudomonas aeruginosa]|uniref:hypothetical protein n=1 Tax=Pseudomonas aeruginosa TaxID=287 RepID=UPI00287E2726|nr:hypothetical protein [Pseudomonas aeruginosa]MDS9918383.1 hypothetical protein [Pseudomonas aeruginosa]HCF2940936.1 hypothetical protein [Pseudomonas aeruginosa]
MSMQYPLSIYKVALNAELSDCPQIRVTQIPCKRTSKQFMTAHGRAIKHESLMKPTSVVDSKLLMEYVYCLTEEDVQEAVELLLKRAQKKADDMLAKATALKQSVYRTPIITRNNWSDES